MNRLLLLFSSALLVISCAPKSPPDFDEVGAHNAFGGCRRANDYSEGDASPVGSLGQVILDSTKMRTGLHGAPLPVSYDRSVVLFGDGTLAMLRSDSITHRYNFPEGQHPMSALAADSLGTIYAVTTTGSVFAFDTACNLKWRVDRALGNDSGGIVVYSFPLALNTGVVIGNSRGVLARFDADGKRKWQLGNGVGCGITIATEPQFGIVAVLSADDYNISDTVISVDPVNGTKRWATALPGMRIVTGPAIIGNCIVVGSVQRDAAGNRQAFLTALGAKGEALWQQKLTLIPRGISGDNEGNIYVAASGVRSDFGGGSVTAYKPDGTKRWEQLFESAVTAAPVISSSWIYFVARRADRTGIFTYGHDGKYNNFIPVDILPNINSQIIISPTGKVVFTCTERPALLYGN